MSLPANATMVFQVYEVLDAGISMVFLCPDPGPGMPSEYAILLTDADLAGVTNQSQLAALITTKLQRKYRASGIATKLDPFLGQSLVLT